MNNGSFIAGGVAKKYLMKNISCMPAYVRNAPSVSRLVDKGQ